MATSLPNLEDDESEKDWEDLFPFYQLLCRKLEIHDFQPWLISRNVMTFEDFEAIERRCVRRSEGIGTMIDMLTRRGRKGYIAFLQVLEYQYSEIYTKITKREPGEPPEDFVKVRKDKHFQPTRTNSRRKSEILMEIINKMMENQAHAINQTADNISQMKKTADELQEENKKLELEAARLEEELERIEQENRELIDQRDDYKCAMNEAKSERNELQKENERLKLEKQNREQFRKRYLEIQPRRLPLELCPHCKEAESMDMRLLREENSKLQAELEETQKEVKKITEELRAKESSWHEQLTKREEIEAKSRTHSFRLRTLDQRVGVLNSLIKELQSELKLKNNRPHFSSPVMRPSKIISTQRLSPETPTRHALIWTTSVDVAAFGAENERLTEYPEDEEQASTENISEKFLSRQDAVSVDNHDGVDKMNDQNPVVILLLPDEIKEDVCSALTKSKGMRFVRGQMKEETATRSELINLICALEILHYETTDDPYKYRCLTRSVLNSAMKGLPDGSVLFYNAPPAAAFAMFLCDLRPLVINVMIGAESNKQHKTASPTAGPAHLCITVADEAKSNHRKIVDDIAAAIRHHLTQRPVSGTRINGCIDSCDL